MIRSWTDMQKRTPALCTAAFQAAPNSAGDAIPQRRLPALCTAAFQAAPNSAGDAIPQKRTPALCTAAFQAAPNSAGDAIPQKRLPALLDGYRFADASTSRLNAAWKAAVQRAAWLQFLLILSVSPAFADETYMMDGKPISKSLYEAGMLVQESMALLHANRNEEAKQKLIKAVALAPDYPDAHHDYGLALAKTGDLRGAANQFQLAVKLNPGLEPAWMSLGGVYQANGQVKEALETYQQLLVRFPNSPDASQVKDLIVGLSKLTNNQPKPTIEQGLTAQTGSDYLAAVTKSGAAHWSLQKMPLAVYMRPATTVAGFQPQFAEILQECFADWSRASGNLFTFKFVDSEPDADIICSWTADSKSFANAAELGEVELTTAGNHIVGATLKLLTVPSLPGATMTPNTMRSTCLHEIGHLLGLTGHTTNPGDIMFYDSATIYDHRRELSQQDINTIRKFYSAQ